MPVPILFVHYGDEWIRGSERVLLDLLANLERRQFSAVVWCNGREMSEAVRKLGFPVYRSRFDVLLTSIKPNYRVERWGRQIWQGIKVISENRVRLVHSNGGGPMQWMLPAARFCRVPILAHLHAPYLKRDRYAFGLRYANRLVGVSRHVLGGLEQDGVSKEKMMVIYNGIDTQGVDRLNNDPDLISLADSGKIILTFAGSLIYRKGVDLLLRSVQALSRDLPVYLIVAGEGPERPALERLASDLGITAHVRFLGFRPELGPIYRQTDIAVHPARSEAFGLVLAEAAAYGVPVVASRVGGIPEVVVEGETGLLCEPESVDSLTRMLLRLIKQPELRNSMRIRSREWALNNFTVDKMAARFHSLYEEMTRLRPPAQAGCMAAQQRSSACDTTRLL